jgi:UDP-N-acetylglucosamine/UDP-N-acetylgalactosamine diphosphorylase
MEESATVPSVDQLRQMLRPVGQEHLVKFWDELDAAERRQLAGQIAEIDFDALTKLRRQYGGLARESTSDETPWATLAQRAEAPPAVRLDGSGLPCSTEEARQRGEEALRAGQIGMILVAGGLGTRLGFDRPKGMFQLGPLSRRPLFQILIDHLRAVSRRYGKPIPLYVMTSEATDAETRAFFAEHANFGLDRTQLQFFRQGAMWALDDRGDRILLEAKGRLFVGPDGHGGMLRALDRSGALNDMLARNLQHIFYGQIDNPLLQVCDPLLIGSHIATTSEMTTQVVRKRQPLEKVGNVVSIDGRVQVIEYSDLPEDVARKTNPDGTLALWAGNLAVHVFAVDFLRRMSRQTDALPFHLARKKVPYVDDHGRLVTPEKPNALRFERFIFDLLPAASNALVVEADPAEAFAPVKNADNEASDTPTTARAAMVAQARRRLTEAGVRVKDGVTVEINPLWALDAAEIRSKLPEGTVIDRPTYFGELGPQS